MPRPEPGDIVAPAMSFRNTVLWGSVAWLVLISALHASLNLGSFQKSAAAKGGLKIGYLPVT